MGILTLLRNAFGRSRKGRSAEGEPSRTVPSPSTEPEPTATPAEVPAQSTPTEPVEVPAQSSSRGGSDEHDLVSAAFDNVTVPRQPTREPEAGVTEEPAGTTEPEAPGTTERAVAEEPTVAEEPAVTAEPDVPGTAEPEVAEMFGPEGPEIGAWLASCRESVERYFALEDPTRLEPA